MSTELEKIESLTRKEYKYGFVTDIESDELPLGLNEDIIRALSKKKNEPEFLLKWRLFVDVFLLWFLRIFFLSLLSYPLCLVHQNPNHFVML